MVGAVGWLEQAEREGTRAVAGPAGADDEGCWPLIGWTGTRLATTLVPKVASLFLSLLNSVAHSTAKSIWNEYHLHYYYGRALARSSEESRDRDRDRDRQAERGERRGASLFTPHLMRRVCVADDCPPLSPTSSRSLDLAAADPIHFLILEITLSKRATPSAIDHHHYGFTT